MAKYFLLVENKVTLQKDPLNLQVVILLPISEVHDTGTEAFWISILQISILRTSDNYTYTRRV